MSVSILKRLARKFNSNTSGAVAIFYAMAAIPLLLAVGTAIDYARAQNVSIKLQNAIDSAALSAASAKGMDAAQRKVLAIKTFQHNFYHNTTSGDFKVTPVVQVIDEEVKVSVQYGVPMTFMKLANIDTFNLSESATVKIDSDRSAEIALVLDYSGSMDWDLNGEKKYITMRNAAIKMIDDAVAEGKSNKIKFGLVPFSNHVYVDLPGQFVIGGTPGSTWTGCTVDRKFPFNTKVKTPVDSVDNSKWGQPQAAIHSSYGCDGYVSNNLRVVPITDDHQKITDQLKVMTPYAWTHIAVGFSFGWHLLDAGAPYTNVEPKADKRHLKFLVLLTDGAQTEPAWGPGGARAEDETGTQGGLNLERACTNAKNDGITVVTVAFNLDDATTVNRLRNCASGGGKYFYNAEDSDGLRQVFDEIKSRIANAVYISN